jgi:hypothetical protein
MKWVIVEMLTLILRIIILNITIYILALSFRF